MPTKEQFLELLEFLKTGPWWAQLTYFALCVVVVLMCFGAVLLACLTAVVVVIAVMHYPFHTPLVVAILLLFALLRAAKVMKQK